MVETNCYSGEVVLNVGGNWNNSANAGIWYLNGNNDASNSNNNTGCRKRIQRNSVCHVYPLPLGKTLYAHISLVGKSRNTRSEYTV